MRFRRRREASPANPHAAGTLLGHGGQPLDAGSWFPSSSMAIGGGTGHARRARAQVDGSRLHLLVRRGIAHSSGRAEPRLQGRSSWRFGSDSTLAVEGGSQDQRHSFLRTVLRNMLHCDPPPLPKCLSGPFVPLGAASSPRNEANLQLHRVIRNLPLPQGLSGGTHERRITEFVMHPSGTSTPILAMCLELTLRKIARPGARHPAARFVQAKANPRRTGSARFAGTPPVLPPPEERSGPRWRCSRTRR